jgi:hypothetical protein
MLSLLCGAVAYGCHAEREPKQIHDCPLLATSATCHLAIKRQIRDFYPKSGALQPPATWRSLSQIEQNGYHKALTQSNSAMPQ